MLTIVNKFITNVIQFYRMAKMLWMLINIHKCPQMLTNVNQYHQMLENFDIYWWMFTNVNKW